MEKEGTGGAGKGRPPGMGGGEGREEMPRGGGRGLSGREMRDVWRRMS